MAIVYPNGFNILNSVLICGVALMLSNRAIAGCFTPDRSANSFCDSPFCSLASISLLKSQKIFLAFFDIKMGQSNM